MSVKYYSLNRINKTQATYKVIFGERSNGKTFASLKYAIEKWVDSKGKSQVGYVRRWKEDVTGKRASRIFDGINEQGVVTELTDGAFTGVTYWAGKFYLCNYDETGKPIYNDNDLLGFTFALTDSEHDKGVSYPNIDTIIFDEFLTKHTYLQDEFVIFMNVVSTIVRKRTNVEIFMLGNTVSRYAPYFKEMGLTHINKMEQGTIDVYKYGESKLTVAVEYCDTLNKDSKTNSHYFAFNNPKLEMITSGAWELNIYPHIPEKYKPKHIQFEYFIEFSDKIFHAEVIQIEDRTFTYIHEKTTPIKNPDSDLVYTLEFDSRLNYNRNIYKPMNIVQKRILWYFVHDRVYYQDNEVGDSISNYLKICKGVK